MSADVMPPVLQGEALIAQAKKAEALPRVPIATLLQGHGRALLAGAGGECESCAIRIDSMCRGSPRRSHRFACDVVRWRRAPRPP